MDDQAWMWKISSTKHVFMAGVTFVIKSKDGACKSYYTGNPTFDNVSVVLLVHLCNKTLDALKCSRL